MRLGRRLRGHRGSGHLGRRGVQLQRGGALVAGGVIAASSSADAVLSTADSPSYGTIVVDGTGMTVYMFDKDTQGSGASTCSGQCLVAWPPVIADSRNPAGRRGDR